ncbi:polysaccharide export protein [Parvibaculum lavamentivorans DS-1]|uniref:Polysaccharide export protein n=1 Tax=Parvibaculum lavamentivorans (strain DS-1 / DSM 13023 / NCIMB 13966) TaxID=402881 RepID=A7HXH4_PARL1|nr:polysaccharide biosynthesis/export family protein [Parvibaculum lavamentivorans]ABS64607.1 polysaccharide export protein [Parvibaculum lavamentivorans DS-1]
MNARLALVLMVIGAFAAGCAERGLIAERPIVPESEIYRLDTGDQLRVVVFGQSDLSGDFTVDGTGAISMPLLPPLVARGMTTDEFERAVADELGAKLLRNPNVSVQVTQFRPFFILGEVQRAGQYPFVNGMTVQSAAAIAGGFTYRADADRVKITRNRGDRIVELGVDSNAPVMPGDTILVKERYF